MQGKNFKKNFASTSTSTICRPDPQNTKQQICKTTTTKEVYDPQTNSMKTISSVSEETRPMGSIPFWNSLATGRMNDRFHSEKINGPSVFQRENEFDRFSRRPLNGMFGTSRFKKSEEDFFDDVESFFKMIGFRDPLERFDQASNRPVFEDIEKPSLHHVKGIFTPNKTPFKFFEGQYK
eukprot:TRINITY_DN40492_c0_g1_i1.p1 TRINITY_DN40492_c0_g1~~TRINITY_DN40492_c0_g1_i1.p1  ORF type:complete len:179 (+),score=13.60 TRINITY_DN40492_c0_g1_i1:10-546(+)